MTDKQENKRSMYNQLDKLVVNYQTSNKAFYNKYQSARIIVDLGRRGETELSEQPAPLTT